MGFFNPGDPAELIGGQLIVAEPQGSRHVIAIRLAEQALRAAFGSGRDVRTQGHSGVPHADTDARAHVELVFALAHESDRDVDFHLDTFDEAPALSLGHVAALTVKQGWQGRVCAGHMTALGALEPAELAPIAAMIRDTGISVLALPATDLYLMGGGDTRNVRRGLAPVRRLADAGVNVAVSTNNVQSPFTPWGDADLLRMANLLATVAHLGTVEDLSLAFRMATGNTARAIRLRDYGLVEGARADLVLLDCREPAEAVAAIPERLYVIEDGAVSVENRVRTLFAHRPSR